MLLPIIEWMNFMNRFYNIFLSGQKELWMV